MVDMRRPNNLVNGTGALANSLASETLLASPSYENSTR
jgi:hypothetical protein